jgi:predicted dienelactone hydrolase
MVRVLDGSEAAAEMRDGFAAIAFMRGRFGYSVRQPAHPRAPTGPTPDPQIAPREPVSQQLEDPAQILHMPDTI